MATNRNHEYAEWRIGAILIASTPRKREKATRHDFPECPVCGYLMPGVVLGLVARSWGVEARPSGREQRSAGRG